MEKTEWTEWTEWTALRIGIEVLQFIGTALLGGVLLILALCL